MAHSPAQGRLRWGDISFCSFTVADQAPLLIDHALAWAGVTR